MLSAKMVIRRRRLLAIVAASFLDIRCAYSEGLDAQQKALEIIGNFADRICTTPPLEGQSTDIKLSGQAKAELSSILKQIAELGIEGSGVFIDSIRRKAFRQGELAEAIAQGNDCKFSVFKELKDKLLLSQDRDTTQKLLVELLHEDFKVRVNARWQLAQLGQTAVPELTSILMAYPRVQYKETLGALSAFAAMDKEICRRTLNENTELKDKIVSISHETDG